MPKPWTSPTLIDDLTTLNIGRLKEMGLLERGNHLKVKLTFSTNGSTIAQMGVKSIIDQTPRLEFSYLLNGEPVDYTIYLEEIKSNLGNGSFFQFICPKTFKRCRKLHLVNGYLMHRSNLINAMYECQTQSKAYRSIKQIFEPYVLQDKYYSELNKPYFKTHYRGKPTKRYIWLMNKLRMASKMNLQDYERLLMFGF